MGLFSACGGDQSAAVSQQMRRRRRSLVVPTCADPESVPERIGDGGGDLLVNPDALRCCLLNMPT